MIPKQIADIMEWCNRKKYNQTMIKIHASVYSCIIYDTWHKLNNMHYRLSELLLMQDINNNSYFLIRIHEMWLLVSLR